MTYPQVTLESPAETRERCAAAGTTWLGDRVVFLAQGDHISRLLVLGIIERAGYSRYLPREPKPEARLSQAARKGRTPNGYFVRRFVSPLKDTPLAFHVTHESGDDESGDEYHCLARVRIIERVDPQTGAAVPVAVARPPEGQIEYQDDKARARAQDIADECNRLLDHADNGDIGRWLRHILRGLGASQSLGRGNNWYLPASACEQFHDFMTELSARCHVYYERDPKEVGGGAPPQDRALFAASAQVSLSEQIEEVRELLLEDVDKASDSDPDKSAKRREDSIRRHLERLQEISARFALYDGIVETQVLAPLREAKELYQRKFEQLLGGETPFTDDLRDTEPAEESAAKPTGLAADPQALGPTVLSKQRPCEEDDNALSLAMAPNGNDDLSWCC